MADTSTPRATIQEELDFKVSPDGDNLRSFVIRAKDGDCSVPKNVHARFYNCKFKSFKATDGNNNFYFKDCTFQENGNFQVKDAILLIEKSDIKTKLIAESSKLEITNTKISKTVLLKNKTYLKSFRNSWTGSEATGIDAQTGSRVESSLDGWSDWTTCLTASGASFVRVSTPAFGTVGTFAKASENALVAIQNTNEFTISKTGIKFLIAEKYGRIEFIGGKDINIDGTLVDVSTGGEAILRNLGKLTGKGSGNFIHGSQGTLEISSVESITENGTDTVFLFEKGTTCKVFNVQTLKANNGSLFSLDNTCTLLINGLTTDNSYGLYSKNTVVQATSDNDNKKTSKVVINSYPSVQSSSGTGFDIKDCNLTINNVTNVKGGSNPAIIAKNNCRISLSNITTFGSNNASGIAIENGSLPSYLMAVDIKNFIGATAAGASAIQAAGAFSGVLKNIETIKSGGKGILLQKKGVLTLDTCSLIEGSNSDGISVGESSFVSLNNVKQVKGTIGINVGNGKNSRLSLKNFSMIQGTSGQGIYGTDCNVYIDTSGMTSAAVKGSSKGIDLNTSKSGYELTMNGPLQIQGSTAISVFGYTVLEQGVVLSGELSATNCVYNGKFSKFNNAARFLNSSGRAVNSKFAGELVVQDKAALELVRASVTGAPTISASSVLALSTSMSSNFNSLSSGSFLGLKSKIANASPSASFVGMFNGAIGNVSPTGKSTVLVGSLQSGTITPTADAATSPVGAFAVEGGKLFLQSADQILVECLNYQGTIRGTFTETITGAVTQTMQSTWSVTATGNITLTSTPSNILITPSAITVTATTVTI